METRRKSLEEADKKLLEAEKDILGHDRNLEGQKIDSLEIWEKERLQELTRRKVLHPLINLQKDLQNTTCEVVLLTYLLTEPESKDDDHGMIFLIDKYANRQKAKKKAAKLIEKYDLQSLKIVPLRKWIPISRKSSVDKVEYISTGSKNKVKELEEKSNEEVVKDFKREQKLRKKIEEQKIKSEVPGTVENHSYNWWNAIQEKSIIEYHRHKLKEAEKSFNKAINNIKSNLEMNPELESEWLPKIQESLKERGELTLALGLENGYKMLKDQI